MSAEALGSGAGEAGFSQTRAMAVLSKPVVSRGADWPPIQALTNPPEFEGRIEAQSPQTSGRASLIRYVY